MVFIMKLEVEDIYTEKVPFGMGFHQRVEFFQVKKIFLRNSTDFYQRFFKNVSSFKIQYFFFQSFYVSLYLEILHSCMLSEKFEVRLYLTHSTYGM